MSFSIGKNTLSKKGPLYFIADIAANHEGDLNRAYRLIELAKKAGAHAAKFQNFQAAKIVSKNGFDDLGGKFAHQSTWEKSVFEIYEDASISKDWTTLLKEKCKEVDIDYFTSPYDVESVDLVEPFVDVYKIGSGDITWHEMIKYISQKNKPVIMATGASSLDEVKKAMAVLSENTSDIVLMQCNTNYTTDPSKYGHVNLNVLKEYEKLFPEVILGLSDHTLGHATVLGAIALGATVFEKHFTDDNNRPGPDHAFAMSPTAWREMVDRGNELYMAMGDGIKRVEDNEKESIIVQRRCLRATTALTKGTVLTEENIIALRPIPEGGIDPYKIDSLIGKTLNSDLKEGDHFKAEDFLN